ncbi:MAG TPA: DUF58 domain-containing protein [Gemmatimonadaceae bacterium]
MSIAEHGALLEAVRGLTWPARRRTSGTLPGIHPSRLRGRAPELSEYRLYRQGDDPALLDWKLLARSDRAYVRLADDRAILATWFVVDASASMGWPIETLAKWRLAGALVVALASVVAAAGDPVGLLVAHAQGVTRLPPRSRRGVVRDLAATLAEVEPTGSATLAPALAGVRPGTRVVVLSDFLGLDEETRRAVRGLAAAGSDVHGVQVIAREELDPPRRVVRAVDPEDASIARPLDEASRAAYLTRFAAWREATAREWREAGATFTEVATDDDPSRAVRRIVGAGASRPTAGA